MTILKREIKYNDIKYNNQVYGLNSLSFRGSLLWNTTDDEIKYHLLLTNLKRKYVDGMALAVHVSFPINLALLTFN